MTCLTLVKSEIEKAHLGSVICRWWIEYEPEKLLTLLRGAAMGASENQELENEFDFLHSIALDRL